MFDVAIIGAGVVGAMIARKLSEYELKICILEKENDVAEGATKANSAIVHAGYDAECGSFKAKLNVKGSEMMEKICRELDVKYINNGSLVVGFSAEDRKLIKTLFERGNKNGVKGLRIVEREELRKIEPNISHNAICALVAPTGAIVCPYELTISAVGNAMDNGAVLKLGFKVSKIEMNEGSYTVKSESGDEISSRYVINAAGVYSDEIAKMVGDNSFNITPRRGEYILLDKECGDLVTHTVFRTPKKNGKGILVSPTVDGNLLTGPTAVDIDDKDDTDTTLSGFDGIIREGSENVENLKFNKSITSFCGLRAVGSTGDFIINSPCKNFINAAGIESPGLSSSPAIAIYIRDMLEGMGLKLIKRQSYNPYRKSPHFFSRLTNEEKNEIIKKDSRYGRIICRCEGITEGEIVYAIRQNPVPTSMDAIKRRTRTQMGRCQGGFCSTYIMEILSRELGVDFCSITKFGGASVISKERTKGDV